MVKQSLKKLWFVHVSMDAPLIDGEDSNLYDVLRSGGVSKPCLIEELLHESLRNWNRVKRL